MALPAVDASAVAGARQRVQVAFYQAAVGASELLAFRLGDAGLEMVQLAAGRMVAIRVDFMAPEVDYRRHRGGGRGEAIVRAVGLRAGEALQVLDATAGMGGDAFVLASVGCRVTMLERVPALQALLADGLARARAADRGADPEFARVIDRMLLVEADAVAHLSALAEADCPDVIYLDPMFPGRRKSAAVKKEMQVFHDLVGGDGDADRLLEVALTRARRRVVVKRPRLADPLAGPAPDHVLAGVRNRFDLYIPAPHGGGTTLL
jgi:16S rRNA (guanine1516-N2)-methyltransferase